MPVRGRSSPVSSLAIAGLRSAKRQARVSVQIMNRDWENRRRWGRDAPRWGQRIWIDPRMCNEATIRVFTRADSGRILGGSWDRETVSAEDHWKARTARLHWEDGVPWEETGAYEGMLRLIAERGRPVDGCSTLSDVVRRYGRLDALFERMRRERRLLTRSELPGVSFREYQGVYVHVGRGGVLFGRGGIHRFMIARLLGLSRVPAQLGAVHSDAVGHFSEMHDKT